MTPTMRLADLASWMVALIIGAMVLTALLMAWLTVQIAHHRRHPDETLLLLIALVVAGFVGYQYIRFFA